jgi:UDP-glucose 4-epimerase
LKKKSKNILVVGGTGFIGYNLIKSCLKKKIKVTCVSSKKPFFKKSFPKVNFIVCDIRNKKLLKKKLTKEYNYVVNLAGYVDHSNKKETFSSHYYGCLNISNIFLSKKIESFVQIGSGLEYGNNKSPQKETNLCRPQGTYALAKYKASVYLLKLFKDKKFPCTIVRLYQAYGPDQKFNRLIPMVIKSCLKKSFFACTHGNQKRDFLYIDDLINLIFKIFKTKKSKGKIINAGSGRPIKIRVLIETIKKMSKGGQPLYGKIKMRKDESLSMYPNIFRAKRLLKWRPKYSIISGLKKTIKSYSE